MRSWPTHPTNVSQNLINTKPTPNRDFAHSLSMSAMWWRWGQGAGAPLRAGCTTVRYHYQEVRLHGPNRSTWIYSSYFAFASPSHTHTGSGPGREFQSCPPPRTESTHHPPLALWQLSRLQAYPLPQCTKRRLGLLGSRDLPPTREPWGTSPYTGASGNQQLA